MSSVERRQVVYKNLALRPFLALRRVSGVAPKFLPIAMFAERNERPGFWQVLSEWRPRSRGVMQSAIFVRNQAAYQSNLTQHVENHVENSGCVRERCGV
ncbi:hypothetical protein CGZ80_02680 [Rhodopirellula sp. MGV]|nr:hypothetical protein CGZ80_02680 [Rhodopirellula sp. MGV]PNY38493.1 hypothetical protein C2E31_00740 [Rhodopirellula baltica]